ncbi:glycerophosphodiester phosphodiesterase 1 [Protopterus annectens]|uniref:glycerophosphodiester phosphodiesterase 1 n=1 Tax=Protopterus annectens TaxID=7888 RepID=UPI001CF99C97|nr:glycerophosphodiester phosphodiesterase 1 [Protopterus annectens]
MLFTALSDTIMLPLATIFIVLLFGTRHLVFSSAVVAIVYMFLLTFRFLPLAPARARNVLRPQGRTGIIAHRGGGYDAPENTLAAIRKAAENGATGVELDLEFTADGVAILMHDSTVDRTTNGTGSLSSLTYDEVRKLNPAARHRLREQFPNEKIPTLKEAVVECLKFQLIIYFDVKGHANKAAAALKQIYNDHTVLYNQSIVCSFEPDVIYKMRQADREIVTALTHRPWSLSHQINGMPRFNSIWKHYWLVLMDIILDWSLHNVLWNLCGISAFLIQKDFVSVEYVRYWEARGIDVVAWTVNNAVEKTYFEKLLHCNYITDSLLQDCEPQA